MPALEDLPPDVLYRMCRFGVFALACCSRLLRIHCRAALPFAPAQFWRRQLAGSDESIWFYVHVPGVVRVAWANLRYRYEVEWRLSNELIKSNCTCSLRSPDCLKFEHVNMHLQVLTASGYEKRGSQFWPRSGSVIVRRMHGQTHVLASKNLGPPIMPSFVAERLRYPVLVSPLPETFFEPFACLG